MLTLFLLVGRIYADNYTANEADSHFWGITKWEFGFDVGGEANISVTRTDVAMVVGLITWDEYKNAQNVKFSPTDYCGENATKRMSKYQTLIEKQGTFSVIIEEKEIYVPFYMLCSLPSQWNATYNFRNKDGYLDYRWKIPMVGILIVAIFYTILLAFWLINWFLHSIPKIGIHIWITVALTTGMVLQYGLYVTFVFRDRDASSEPPKAHKLGAFGGIVGVIYNLILLAIVALANKGWCIATPSNIMDCGCTWVWGYFGLLWFLLIAHWWNNSETWFLLPAILHMIQTLLIFSGGKTTLWYLNIQVMSIDDMEENHPIHRRYRSYQVLRWCLIGYMCIKMVHLCFRAFAARIYRYYNWLIGGLIDGILWMILVWKFHLRSDHADEYYIVHDQKEAAELYYDSGRVLREFCSLIFQVLDCF